MPRSFPAAGIPGIGLTAPADGVLWASAGSSMDTGSLKPEAIGRMHQGRGDAGGYVISICCGPDRYGPGACSPPQTISRYTV